jgi:DMSO/TMAO reductase YedYZ molybdopterin-dependent catalytic subunit
MTKLSSLFLAGCIATLGLPAMAHDTGNTSVETVGNFTLKVDTKLLAGLPRKEVSAASHDEAPQQWEGVALIDVLRKAGAPVDKLLRGMALTKIVRITAADGYQIVFSLTELDAGFANANVLLADKQNGKALSPETGPYRLVVAGDKRAGRWIRNVQTIELLDSREAEK